MFQLERVFKHDFFAATVVYAGPQERIVVKFGRQADFLGLPMGWVGRLLTWHEAQHYERLADLAVVPTFRGRLGRNAFAHAFVEGEPLRKGVTVPDAFFPALWAAIDELHGRGAAYVDLEKPTNVLLGADGRPYLIDFQIAWNLPRCYGGETFIGRWIRRRLQRGDRYHLRKLQRRFRPDQLSAAELAASYQRPLAIRIHRFLTRPFTRLRRRTLHRFEAAPGDGERGAV